MKIFLAIVLTIAVLSVGFYAFNSYIYRSLQGEAPISQNGNVSNDHKNIAYKINGQEVVLVDGTAKSEAAPGSASMIETRYFGNELHTDLNGDGKDDIVFLLTQTTGGSGVFYYAVAAVTTQDGFKGSEGFFLGDRIAPQSTNRGEGSQVIVNYADRAAGEAFSVQPSVGHSVTLLLDPDTMQFTAVTQHTSSEDLLSSRTLVATDTYTCDSNKAITAAYYDGKDAPEPEAGQPPVPTGSVDVSLEKGATTTLMQTISGSGVRYANADESFVFWNKGNTALIMRNNSMDLNYSNCVAQ